MMPRREDEVEDSGENDPARSANRWLLNAIKPVAPQAGPGGQIILPEGGTLREEGDRADFYDARGNRTGYGVQRGAGSWDFFRTDGSRLGRLTPAIGGGSRLTISPPRRT